MRTCPIAICLGLLGAAPLVAQGRPLRVVGVRGVSFGTVLPGLPRTVLRTDPANSGEFDLSGFKFSQLELTFTLPSVLNGPAGASMPLSFGSSDAGYSVSQSIASQVGFDPRQPFVAVLSNNGRGSVFVGATANPLASQRAGSYTGTLTLTVAYLP